MPKTWGDIKKEALQLMFSFSLNGDELMNDGSTLDYRKAMVNAANYALRDLAGTAAPIVRRLSISVAPVPNMLGDGNEMFQSTPSVGSDILYTAVNSKAFYCEVDNPCIILLEKVNGDGTTTALAVANMLQKRQYQPWVGLIAAGEGTYQLRFVGRNSYRIRNVAFYAVGFDSADDVPPFTRYDRYDLRKLTANNPGYEFMALAPNNVVRVSADTYARSDDFRWEGDSVMVFDHYSLGQYDIYYHAYPVPITESTSDDYSPELIDEALDLVPLYIAARLYADNDAQMATGYLNRYMARRSELSGRDTPLGTGEIAAESGWV